jgi:CDP-diacylglycerol--glycerol-3-phosphate 3-phosphatidyltransferase
MSFHFQANGFQGAKGPAGGIPAAYSLIARRFLENIKKKSQEHRFSLFEYERDQWTYHAKGLWLYPPSSSLPHLTFVGSSNYGERSVNRDLESQICVVTTNKNLQKSLQNEYNHIFSHAATAETQLVVRTIPNWVKVVVGLFKNFF